MTHELTIRDDGRVEMAFRQGTDPPWRFGHARAQQVPAGASIDDWVRAAGMEWKVLSAEVQYELEALLYSVDRRRVLYRSDTLAPLGIVSNDYRILHPREVLEFFTGLTQSAGFELESAGTLFGGRRFWAFARIGEDCIAGSRDLVRGYLLLTSSADGAHATEVRTPSMRLSCLNMLGMPAAGGAQIRVTHRAAWRPDAIKRRLGLAPKTFAEFMASMRRLADYRMRDDRAELELKSFLPVGQTFAKTMELFRGSARGYDQPGFAGTAWGLLNSFTETLDHGGYAKSESHRFANATMGAGERAKAAFRDRLLALVR